MVYKRERFKEIAVVSQSDRKVGFQMLNHWKDYMVSFIGLN